MSSRVILFFVTSALGCWANNTTSSSPSTHVAEHVPAKQPEPVRGCPKGERVLVVKNHDDLELRKKGSDSYDELLLIKWRVDINGDNAADMAVKFMGTAGNRGEYQWSVLVSCGRNEYVVVWGPTYVYEIEKPEAARPNEGWRDLVTDILVEQGDRSKHDRIERRTLHFADGRYEQVP